MTVSVIIPFENYARTLEAAIRGVLDQTCAPTEIVLVDDGSTDGSAAIARRYSPPAVLLRRQNGGAGAARNQGVAASSGDLIAFCDADDLWAATKLERQLAVLAAHPAVDAVFAGVSEFEDPLPEGRLRAPRERVPGALPSAMLIRRASFHRVGPFAEAWRIGEWAEWFTRMRAAALKEIWLPDVLVWRRLHPGGSGVRHADRRLEYVRILRAHLQRQRRSGNG